jgi:hypothetical protein
MDGDDRAFPLFDAVSRSLSNIESFHTIRRLSRDFFTETFLSADEKFRSTYANQLYRWSQEKLRSRQKDDRLVALAGLSFCVDLEDDNTQLLTIAQNIERSLPIDSICLIDGIANLIKRIARRVPNPIIPRLIERCVS